MSITISITPAQFAELVTPVIPFADRGPSLPALECILIRSQGDYLTALSTDRYRAAIHRVRPKETPEAGLYALLHWRDAQYITRMFKAGRGHKADPMTFTFDGTRVTVTTGGVLGQFLEASASFATPAYDFPPMSTIWPTEETLRTVDPVSEVAFNAKYMADFKVAANGEPIRVISRKGKPTIVMAGDDFVCAIMPVRGGVEDNVKAYGEWADILSASTSLKTEKKVSA